MSHKIPVIGKTMSEMHGIKTHANGCAKNLTSVFVTGAIRPQMHVRKDCKDTYLAIRTIVTIYFWKVIYLTIRTIITIHFWTVADISHLEIHFIVTVQCILNAAMKACAWPCNE